MKSKNRKETRAIKIRRRMNTNYRRMLISPMASGTGHSSQPSCYRQRRTTLYEECRAPSFLRRTSMKKNPPIKVP